MGIAVCSQKCINIPGSYQCLCDRGFQLSADGSRCEDIDECVLWSTSGKGQWIICRNFYLLYLVKFCAIICIVPA